MTGPKKTFEFFASNFLRTKNLNWIRSKIKERRKAPGTLLPSGFLIKDPLCYHFVANSLGWLVMIISLMIHGLVA